MIIAILGKSCVGKDTIVSNIMEKKYEDFVSIAKSFTTRPMRKNEQNGKEYYFITEKEYMELYKNNKIVVSTEYKVGDKTYRYGVTREELEKKDINIMIVNPYGLRDLKRIYPENQIISVLIRANEIKRILRYIKRDKLTIENTKNCFRRMKADTKDFRDISVDYIIDNKNIVSSINRLKEILDAEIIVAEYKKEISEERKC